MNPVDRLRERLVEAGMAEDTLEYTVTEKTVTITLVSPVAETVARQVEAIMIRVNGAKDMGLRKANIIDLLYYPRKTTEQDIHPGTVAALALADMRIEAEYAPPTPNLGGHYAAPDKLTALYVVW